MSFNRKEKIHTSSNCFKNSSSKVPKNFIGIFLLIAMSCAFLYSCNVSGSDDENPPSDQNTAPVAELSYSPSNPATGDNITLDGSSSSDADGEITNYRWDLDGDGNVDESSSSPTTTHTYSNTGDVTVSLEVVDDNEATDEDTVTVTVSSSNSAPSANFTYSPSNPTVGETITFDASGSSDPDGTISSYKWDYDGDGNFDQTTQTATVNTSYSSGGNYDVTLKVVDDEQASDQVTKTISVAGNSAPSADFAYSPSSPSVGEDVTLDASASYDPDGTVVYYKWDFDGDGNYDRTSENPTTVTSYSQAGSYDVKLKIIDDEEAEATVTNTISVGT